MELAPNKSYQEHSSSHQNEQFLLEIELFPQLNDMFFSNDAFSESLQPTCWNDWRDTQNNIDKSFTLAPTFFIENVIKNDTSICNNYKKETTQKKHSLFQLKEKKKTASVKKDVSEITQINTKKPKINNSVSLSFQVKDKEKGAQTKQIMKSKKNESQKKENIIIQIKQEEDKELPVLKADDENSLLEQFELFNKCVGKRKSISTANSIKLSQIKHAEDKNNMKNTSILQTVYQDKKLQKKKGVILNKKVTSGDTRKISTKTVCTFIPSFKKSIKTISVTSVSQEDHKNSDITKTAEAGTSVDMKIYDFPVASNVLSDHNYAGYARNSNANEPSKQVSLLKSKYQKVLCDTMECFHKSSSKTDSNLKSTNVSGTNKKPVLTLFNHTQATDNLSKNIHCSKTTKESDTVNNISSNNIDKITSVLTKIKKDQAEVCNSSLHGNTQLPMISVLKKLSNSIPAVLPHSDTNIATSACKLIQNVVKPNAEHAQEQTTKPRKKLNLSEYRNRRGDDGKIDSLQRTILIDVCHAYTTTEPIDNPINPLNPIWSERIILSVTKNKSEFKKSEPKPITCEKEIQTYETLFELSTKVANDTKDKEEESKKGNSTHDSKDSCNREKSIEILEEIIRRSRSLSRYRSKDKSRNNRKRSKTKSKTRSRNSRSSSSNNSRSSSKSTRSRRSSRSSRSKNRSRSRSGTRSRSSFSNSNSRYRKRRRVSRRRSSVISSTSNSRSSHSFTSKSRHSRSRSRSFRSRSRSYSRYYSRSRSSSRSTFDRNRGSNYRRSSNDRERSYMEKNSRYRKDPRMYRRAGYHQRHADNRISWRSLYRRPHIWNNREKQKEVEERRVVYVGRLGEEVTKSSLRRRFEVFGSVMDVSIHFRENADNYGFVTFERKEDAYDAVEHGNDNPSLPRYDLSFGGRRAFCKTRYADLDNMETSPVYNFHYAEEEIGFDYLLEKAKADLRKNKQKQHF